MEYITVTSIGGSKWTIRKDRIEMLIKRFKFSKEDIANIPELKAVDSCAIIRLIGLDRDYYCKDTYESIIKKLE